MEDEDGIDAIQYLLERLDEVLEALDALGTTDGGDIERPPRRHSLE